MATPARSSSARHCAVAVGADREREHLATLRPVAPYDEPDIDEMWDALGRLPVKQRAALVLRYYDDWSHEQIASALHCTVSSSRSLIHRGLAALRKDFVRWNRT